MLFCFVVQRIIGFVFQSENPIELRILSTVNSSFCVFAHFCGYSRLNLFAVFAGSGQPPNESLEVRN